MRADYFLCTVCCTSYTKSKLRVCRACSTFDVAAIDEAWYREFTGLFFGEGNIDICHKVNRGRDCTYIRLVICLRSDDEPLLRNVQAHLGGTISRRSKARTTSHPQTSWTLSRAGTVYHVLLRMQQSALLPARKLVDVEIGLAWCRWRFTEPHWVNDAGPGLALRAKLRSSRAFTG
jgi:hypothetical protein